MNQFEFFFEGSSANNVDYSVGCKIYGDRATIGRVMAEYAANEIKNGRPDMIIILINASENLKRLLPDADKGNGSGGSAIIKPFH